jgi:hypothetical protein
MNEEDANAVGVSGQNILPVTMEDCINITSRGVRKVWDRNPQVKRLISTTLIGRNVYGNLVWE